MMTHSTATAAAPTVKSSEHLRIARESSFTVNLPPKQAFVLFEPVGEKNWAEDWQPVFASASDAQLAEGSVFTVEGQHSPAGVVNAVWTVVQYAPPDRIEYFSVIPGLRATRILIRCHALAEVTHITVGYDYHGLSAEGDRYLEKITENSFRRMIGQWSASITSYLKRRRPASS